MTTIVPVEGDDMVPPGMGEEAGTGEITGKESTDLYSLEVNLVVNIFHRSNYFILSRSKFGGQYISQIYFILSRSKFGGQYNYFTDLFHIV